jgi:hypothetical protein
LSNKYNPIWEKGGDEEARTPDLRRAKAALSQLSYIPFSIDKVGLVGLEPTTSPLSEERSNRLSYRPISQSNSNDLLINNLDN